MEGGGHDKEVASKVNTSIQKWIPYLWPRWRQNGQNWYPIYDQNGWKTLSFGAAHTYIAHIRDFPPGVAIWTLHFYGWEGSWSNILKCDRTVGFVNLFGSLADSDDHSFYWFRSNPHVQGSWTLTQESSNYRGNFLEEKRFQAIFWWWSWSS